MYILGLTGSIGMGKSTLARMLRRWHLPVHDADATVHRLMSSGGAAVDRIAARFPGVTGSGGGIDRQALGAQVLGAGGAEALKDLEAILHPLVRQAERRFLSQLARNRQKIAVLDIPLLYETGAEKRCDGVVVVTAPFWLQKQRVMRRPGMNEGKFRAILQRQVPDRIKCQRADFVIPTGLGFYPAVCAARGMLSDLSEAGYSGKIWTPSRF